MGHSSFSNYTLERYVLNELDAEARERIEAGIKNDPALKREIDQIKRSNRQILEAFPPDRIVRNINNLLRLEKGEKLVEQSTFSTWTKWSLRIAPAFATLVLFFLISFDREQLRVVTDEAEEQVRIKGLSPQLNVYRQKADTTEKLQNFSLATKGDLIQLGYVSAGKSNGVIFSLDGHRSVTLHFPRHSTASTELIKQGECFLENAYELDNAPDFEHFFFIVGNRPIDVDSVLTIGRTFSERRRGRKEQDEPFSNLPKGLQKISFVLRKESR